MVRRAADAAGTPALAALSAAGIAYTARPYEHRPGAPSYGLEAAAALGVPPAQVFKTLMATVDGTLVAAVVPVTGSLDLKALAAALGGRKAVMADPALAQRRTGYVLGGISPLGQRRPSPVVIDATALQHGTVFVSGGRRGLDIEVAPADLVRATDATTAPIAGP